MPTKEDPYEVLARAQRKQQSGRGTTNTEKRALSDFSKGRPLGRDHFAQVHVAPVSDPQQPGRIKTGDTSTQIGHGIDRVSDSNSDVGALRARVANLEALIAGLSVQTIDVCDSGSPAYMDVFGSDPYT